MGVGNRRRHGGEEVGELARGSSYVRSAGDELGQADGVRPDAGEGAGEREEGAARRQVFERGRPRRRQRRRHQHRRVLLYLPVRFPSRHGIRGV